MFDKKVHLVHGKQFEASKLFFKWESSFMFESFSSSEKAVSCLKNEFEVGNFFCDLPSP
jgi:hypothetical protein